MENTEVWNIRRLPIRACATAFAAIGSLVAVWAQELPTPLGVPKPGIQTEKPYAPQPILPGGVVIPLYPADSPFLNKERVTEPEKYNMTKGVPGRIQSIVNIHNPSIEILTVDPGINTGTVIILAAGGGHRTLNVGAESGDFVPYFYNFGVNCVILRNRLRSDGYEPRTDAVTDAMQAIRLVRAHADEFGFDPKKIGIMGFSAGAELSAPAAIVFDEYDEKLKGVGAADSDVSSRPDFVGLLYPGPTPFARGENPEIPANVPPSFIASTGSGDRVHAIWANEFFAAMLRKGVPNIEMHIYGNGPHAGGLKDRNGTPFGTWQDRFIDWFRDVGFLQKAGVPTKAAKDVDAYVKNPPRMFQGFGGRRRPQ